MIKKYSSDITKSLEQGACFMAAKKFEKAVEKYSEACELMNLECGEDDPDLLYLYGWALFKNAVKNSDVLGQGAAKEKLEETKEEVEKNGEDSESEKEELEGGGMMQFNEQLAEDDTNEPSKDDEDEVNEEEVVKTDESKQTADKPADSEEGEAEQSDFEIAWDILDLTRTLLEKKISGLKEQEKCKLEVPYLKTEKEDELVGKPALVKMEKKLSDVYSLLGDISLETENFNQAATDLKSMIQLREKLYPKASKTLTEAYYRESLALEFIDPSEAIKSMKRALESMKERSKKGEKLDHDIVQEMKQRLYDLEKGDKKIKAEKDRIMKGILGELNPPSKKTDPAKIVNVPIKRKEKSQIHDLTSLVKKRKLGP